MIDNLLYTSELFLAEAELAHFIERLLSKKCPAVVWDTEGLKHKQPDAVINACTKSISILTGPAGTGKTTTLKKIVDSYLKAGLRGAVACAYGKAAKRADEVINAGRSFVNRVQCSTIHSLLQWNNIEGGFSHNRLNRLKYDFIIVDEFPTMDIVLARDFFESIKPGKTRVVLSGDQYQLPSVGPGNVGRDLIQSFVIPQVELDVILRTGPKSGIAYNANLILRGQEIKKSNPETGEIFNDFYFVPRASEEDSLKDIIRWIKESIPSKLNITSNDIQAMAPGKNGIIGVQNLNDLLRKELNTSNGHTVGKYRKGDKVINVRNNKALNIVNGDVGFVIEVVSGKDGSHLVVDYGGFSGPDNDGAVKYKAKELDNVYLAYALTIHKSQGSQFTVSIIPIHPRHTILLNNNLIYTGLTRSINLGMFVGSYKTFQGAVKNYNTLKRKSRLADRLRKIKLPT